MLIGVLLAFAAVAGGLCGWLLSAVLRVRPAARAAALREEERRASEQARLRRELDDFEARVRDHTAVLELLPTLLGQMFSASGRRGVAPLALKLMDQIFGAEQSAVFVARPAHRRLALAAGRGLPPGLQPGADLEYGEGRLGYVAEHKVAMDENDFREASVEKSLGVEVGEGTPESPWALGLKADVVAPMEDDEGGLLGLLCIGGTRQPHEHEKRLLTMVARLTGVALTHMSRLRSVQERADVDGLTGVYNKRYFQNRLGNEIHKAEKGRRPLSLLIIDIDHFKHYNDTNGHLEGDEVLKKVGLLLKGSIREDDVPARYGGEEFILLYPGAGKRLALRLAEGLRSAVASFAFPQAARQPLGALTISGGVATFPEDARNGVDLIRSADQALYEAKAAGRNRIIAAVPDPTRG